MPDLLSTICRPEILTLAWESVRKNKGRWTPDLAIREIEDCFAEHLEDLALDLRTGRYRPYPLSCHEMEKPSGGTRLICAPYGRDKVAQRAVLMVLEPLAEEYFHPASFGYRPVCTVDMALARIREAVRQGYVWFGDGDVAACFDSIPQEPVLRLVDALTGDRRISALIALWFETLPKRYRVFGDGMGLPQGLVISPFLCNLYLHDFDMDLEEAGIPFVRYADNFMVMARDQAGAIRALEFAAQSLARLGLTLNLEKTAVVYSRPSYRFLGKRLPRIPGFLRDETIAGCNEF